MSSRLRCSALVAQEHTTRIGTYFKPQVERTPASPQVKTPRQPPSTQNVVADVGPRFVAGMQPKVRPWTQVFSAAACVTRETLHMPTATALGTKRAASRGVAVGDKRVESKFEG